MKKIIITAIALMVAAAHFRDQTMGRTKVLAPDSAHGTNPASARMAGFDFVTVKYTSAGDELWVKRYDGPAHNDDRAYGIAVDVFGTERSNSENTGHHTLTFLL